jgi:hypothetical protein
MLLVVVVLMLLLLLLSLPVLTASDVTVLPIVRLLAVFKIAIASPNHSAC